MSRRVDSDADVSEIRASLESEFRRVAIADTRKSRSRKRRIFTGFGIGLLLIPATVALAGGFDSDPVHVVQVDGQTVRIDGIPTECPVDAEVTEEVGFDPCLAAKTRAPAPLSALGSGITNDTPPSGADETAPLSDYATTEPRLLGAGETGTFGLVDPTTNERVRCPDGELFVFTVGPGHPSPPDATCGDGSIPAVVLEYERKRAERVQALEAAGPVEVEDLPSLPTFEVKPGNEGYPGG